MRGIVHTLPGNQHFNKIGWNGLFEIGAHKGILHGEIAVFLTSGTGQNENLGGLHIGDDSLKPIQKGGGIHIGQVNVNQDVVWKIVQRMFMLELLQITQQT